MISDLRQTCSFCPCPLDCPLLLLSPAVLSEVDDRAAGRWGCASPLHTRASAQTRTLLLCPVSTAHFSHCHCPGLTNLTGSGLWRLSGSMLCLPAVLIGSDRKLNLLCLKNVIRMSQDWTFCAILPGFNSNFKVLAHSPSSALAALLWGCCNRTCSVQGAAGTVLQHCRMCPVALVPQCCWNVPFFPTGAFGDFGSAEGTSSGLVGEWGQCLFRAAGQSQFPVRDWTLGNP